MKHIRNPERLLVWACLLLVALGTGCIEPKDQRPGFRLSGAVVNGPVNDWAFTDSVQDIFVETRTWYLLPHSVTTGIAAYNGTIYVPSIYFDGGKFPDDRFWNRNVLRDPHVRLKIGDKIYPRKAHFTTDPAEIQGVFESFAKKYPLWRDLLAKPPAERPGVYFMRMDAETIPAGNS